MTTTEDPNALAEWLSKQAGWLQLAATHLLDGKAVSPEMITEFAKSAIAEARGKLEKPSQPIDLSSLGTIGGGSVKLQSIGNVSGIGQLGPRNPLKFGTGNLTVVYGSNGSGKSSYVRILKHTCGARQKGEIHFNVFEAAEAPQKCSLTYCNGEGEHVIEWTPSAGVVHELSTVDIFDTHCGHSYLASEGKSTYEPRPLAFLSELAVLCDHVATKLQSAVTETPSLLPKLPPNHAETKLGKWYASLTWESPQTDVDMYCRWDETDDTEVDALEIYLAERSPKDRAKEFETKKEFLDGLISSLTEHCAAYTDEACSALMDLRKLARDKQLTAELAAKVNLQEAKLEGVGTKQWLELWGIARAYSNEVAYIDGTFPNIENDARCVLCHQELTADAKIRIQSFEKYVADEASTAAEQAKKLLQEAIKSLPELPDDDTLAAKATSAGLNEEQLNCLKGFYLNLTVRRAMLSEANITENFGDFPQTSAWTVSAQAMADDYAARAKQFLEGFNEQDRNIKAARQKELVARKWIHTQAESIENEIKRLRKIAILEKAKGLCGTRAISLKKGNLAEELITPAYIAAFNAELKRLGARRIKAALVKTRVDRGAILHQVKLSDAVRNKPIQEILSEGEHRIICIAAFLADVASKPNGSTFVFDDPISSLDLDFEESVVQRLVELSSIRQVIVFTHRLSLLGMMEDYAEKAAMPVQLVHIRKEPWGTGEPGDPTIEAAKPKAGLNEHLPKRIAAAKAVLENEGQVPYQIHAQSICTETRKLIERLIEWDLLADVLQRHRRAIKTMNKLDKLADIQPEDCQFLDEMMTKYSRYEHAQSSESPVELPEPSEFLEDVAKLKAWRDRVEARRK